MLLAGLILVLVGIGLLFVAGFTVGIIVLVIGAILALVSAATGHIRL